MADRDDDTMALLGTDDATFVRDLVASQNSVVMLSYWLTRWGCKTHVPELAIRPDVSQRERYSDIADLWLRAPLEVKRRTIAFTSMEDYPYDTVIVCSWFRWQRMVRKPWLHVIISRDGLYACVVFAHTKPRRIATSHHLPGKSGTRKFYECPKELCYFTALSYDIGGA